MALAAHYYRAAADRGYPPSCTSLGDLYYEGGIGILVDMSSAFSYYKMAADAGHAEGCVALGGMWEKGQGVVLVSMTTGVLQQDLAEAVRLYRAAADCGHAEGQSNLGRMYCAFCPPCIGALYCCDPCQVRARHRRAPGLHQGVGVRVFFNCDIFRPSIDIACSDATGWRHCKVCLLPSLRWARCIRRERVS